MGVAARPRSCGCVATTAVRLQVVRCRRDVLEHRAGRRGAWRRGARVDTCAGNAGDRPRPPCRAAGRFVDGGDCDDRRRVASSATHRGRRGSRRFQSGPEALVGDAAQRNPISAETISGSPAVRSNLQAGLSDVALWHERDISHSSVERVILPDTTTLTHYMLVRLTRLLSGLVVTRSGWNKPLVQSRTGVQPAGAVGIGRCRMRRDDAHRIVQRNAMSAWEQRRSFRELLEADPEITVTVDVRRGLRSATGAATADGRSTR